MLLGLWHRPVAAALIQPLAQQHYATDIAVKKKKKKKDFKREVYILVFLYPTLKNTHLVLCSKH